jgi:hypothetical protein
VCALYHTSVYLVLAWTCAAPLALEAVLGPRLLGRQPAPWLQAPLALAAAGVLLEMAADAHRSALGLLMLSLWTVARAGEIAWAWLKTDATAGEGPKQQLWRPALAGRPCCAPGPGPTPPPSPTRPAACLTPQAAWW